MAQRLDFGEACRDSSRHRYGIPALQSPMRNATVLPATDDRLIVLTFRSRQVEASVYAPLRERQGWSPWRRTALQTPRR